MDRLTAIETFIGVVETGSFSGAARRMNVGQPAVSKTIAQLEALLGVRLLIRSTRGLSVTDAGQRYYDHVKRALSEVEEAELAARSSALSGRLRICAAVTFARLHVIPALGAFLAMHPDLKLEIVLDDRVVDVVEEGIDVALRMGALEDSNLTARKLGESPRWVVGSPAYFARAGVPLAPADLVAHDIISYGHRANGDAWSFRREGESVAVTLGGRVTVSAAEGVRAAVLAGLGAAVASEWMFAPELRRGEVSRVLADWTLPSVELWAVFPTGRMVSAKARAFVQFVEETLAAAGTR